MHLSRLTAGLLAAALVTHHAASQGDAFKHALPADTIAFFTVPDLRTSAAEFQQSALAKMWREGEVQDFAREALALVNTKWDEGLAMLGQLHAGGQFPIPPKDLLGLRLHGASFALTHFSVEMAAPGRPEPKIGLLLHLDFGESAATWRELAKFGIAALVEKSKGKLERTATTLDDGIELITLVPPKTAMSLNIAFVDNGVVLGSLKDEVASIVSAIRGKKSILPKDPDYQRTARQLELEGAEMEGFVKLTRVLGVAIDALKFAEQNAPGWPEQLQVDGIDRALTAFGLRSMRTLGFASRYQGGKTITRTFVLAPEADRKGLFAGKAGKLDTAFLRWVPKDVASLSAYSLQVGSIYEALVGAVKAYNPEVGEQLLALLAAQEEQFGMTLKDDLFGVFGDRMVWWSMGVQSFMAAPEGAMLLQVKDQDRLLATLTKVAEMTGGVVDFPVSERKGIKTWRVEINPAVVEQEMAAVLAVVQPCFAFKSGYMVMALSSGDVRKALARMDREDDPKGDIRANKEFAAYLEQMAQQEVSGLDWTDWKASFENLYTAVTSVLPFALSGDAVPIDLTLLPEAETLSQHLFSSMVYSTQTSEGYFSTGTSPIGPEVMLGAVAIGAGVGVGATLMPRQGMAPVVRIERAEPAEVDEKKPDEKPVEEKKDKEQGEEEKPKEEKKGDGK